MDLRFTLTSSIGFILTNHTIGPPRPPAAYHLLTPFNISFLFHLLFHILNLEPESSSEQTSVGSHRTPDSDYLLIYIL